MKTIDPSSHRISRRQAIAAAAAVALSPALKTAALAADSTRLPSAPRGPSMQPELFEDYPALPGIRQRSVHDVNGLAVRILEAGYEAPDRPLVLLLHGFPDVAWSWRAVLPALAEAGYHAVAPDQRGYGGTTGWDGRYDGDYAMFRTHSYALDAMRLVFALGHRSVAAVVGHDFGSMIAAYCALVRPDVFRSLTMVSFPFDGPPVVAFDDAGSPPAKPQPTLAQQLAALPRPREDSMAFFSSRGSARFSREALSDAASFTRRDHHRAQE